MIEELLGLFKSPVTTFTNRAEERNIKKEAIIAGIIALVIAIVTVITSFISINKIVNKKYKSLKDYNDNLYSWEEEITKSDFKEMKKEYKSDLLEDAELVKAFFKKFAITVGVIALIAGILFVIARMVKSPKDYMEMVAMTNSAFIIYLIGFILSTVFSYIWLPLAAIILAGTTIFAIIAIANAFRESIEVEDPNKLVIWSSVVLTIVLAILILIVANYLKSLASLSSLLSLM